MFLPYTLSKSQLFFHLLLHLLYFHLFHICKLYFLRAKLYKNLSKNSITFSLAFSKDSNAKCEFSIKYDDEIVADKNRLFRVFFNLLNNAGDAAKENGRIVFSVKKTGTDVSFLVADNGKGIRKEDICKLFQPFYTSGKIKGTGLGLSVVHDIIEAHNGSIRVRSILGLYTCFLIRIPKDG